MHVIIDHEKVALKSYKIEFSIIRPETTIRTNYGK